jgi:peptidoglycan/LPS O-acetylase OafA/YrhL
MNRPQVTPPVLQPASPAKMDRNRYADLLRVVAISMVVTGHWLLTAGSAG